MRRKVLQDFANTLSQNFVDLGGGWDAAAYVHYGSGTYWMDLITGGCTFNGGPIPTLRVSEEYRTWLAQRCERHRVPPGMQRAELSVDVTLLGGGVRQWSTVVHTWARFHYECACVIQTDEKSYRGEARGEYRWGFDYSSYGDPLSLLEREDIRWEERPPGSGSTSG